MTLLPCGTVAPSAGAEMATVGPVVSVLADAGGQCGVAGGGLGAHVGQQVDLRLLHPRIRRRAVAVVLLVQAPGPLDRACREDQRAAGCPVQGHVVGGGSRRDGVAEVLQVLRGGSRGGGQPDQPRGPEPVVQVFIGFVADGVRRQCGGAYRRQATPAEVLRQSRDFAFGGADGDGQVRVVGHVDGTGQRVLGQPSAVGLGGEPRVAPRAGPLRAGVDLAVGPGFLVGGDGAVGRTVHRGRLKPGAPVHFVAGEELQVHAGVPGGLDVGPLRAGPVFVVAHGQEDLVVQQLRRRCGRCPGR